MNCMMYCGNLHWLQFHCKVFWKKEDPGLAIKRDAYFSHVELFITKVVNPF